MPIKKVKKTPKKENILNTNGEINTTKRGIIDKKTPEKMGVSPLMLWRYIGSKNKTTEVRPPATKEPKNEPKNFLFWITDFDNKGFFDLNSTI